MFNRALDISKKASLLVLPVALVACSSDAAHSVLDICSHIANARSEAFSNIGWSAAGGAVVGVWLSPDKPNQRKTAAIFAAAAALVAGGVSYFCQKPLLDVTGSEVARCAAGTYQPPAQPSKLHL